MCGEYEKFMYGRWKQYDMHSLINIYRFLIYISTADIDYTADIDTCYIASCTERHHIGNELTTHTDTHISILEGYLAAAW